MSTDIRELAETHLARHGAELPPFRQRGKVRAALERCAYGLAYLHGERLAAVMDHGSGLDFTGFIVTTRAIVARFGEERVEIPLGDVARATVSEGLLQTVVEVETKDGKTTQVPVLRGAKPLAALFNAAVADGEPWKPSALSPIIRLEDGDPSGLERLLSLSAQGGNPRTHALLELAAGRLEDGELTVEHARDMAVRIRALQRALLVGRGTSGGKWISPLRVDDLAARMGALFDRETTVRTSGQVTTLDVGKPPEAPPPLSLDKVEDAVMDRLVDAAVTRTLGKKWAKGIKDALADDDAGAVEHIRVRLTEGLSVAALAGQKAAPTSLWGSLRSGISEVLGTDSDAPGHLACYVVTGLVSAKYRDLAVDDPDRVARLNRALVDVEVRALAERILAGPAPTASELAAESPSRFDSLDPAVRRTLAAG